MNGREWVAGRAGWPGRFEESLIVLPRPVAEEQAALWDVLNRCRTWGDVREASADIYLELLERAGYESFEGFASSLAVGTPVPGALEEAARQFEEIGEERPADDDPFDPDEIPSYADGDFPPSPFLLMAELLLPEMEHLGEAWETTFNGTYFELDAARLPDIKAAFEKAGDAFTSDQELISRIGGI